MSLCAFLHPDSIPIEVLSAAAPDLGPILQSIVMDEWELNTALEVLFDLSLLHGSSDTEMLSIHRLVQVVLRGEMNEETQQLWSERALKALSHLFPEPEFDEVWQPCQRYLPHALLASDQIKQWDFTFPEAARLLYRAGSYLYQHANYHDAAYEQTFGPEHPRLATCLNNFAVFCMTLGQYAQAEQLLTQALQIRTQLFGLHHSTPAGSWYNLARVYSKQGRYEQAKTLYEQVLIIYSRQHPNTALLLTHMGELSLLQGDYSLAESLLTEALASVTERQGARHPNVALVLNLLGRLYLAQGEYEQAEQLLTEALAIRQEASGKTHPETCMSLKSLGNLAFVRNNTVQAETFYQQALEILLAPLGAEHPEFRGKCRDIAHIIKTHNRTRNTRLRAKLAGEFLGKSWERIDFPDKRRLPFIAPGLIGAIPLIFFGCGLSTHNAS